MTHEHTSEDDEAGSKALLEEINETLGAVKWHYQPILHFPDGAWKVGAIWDQAYFDASEYILTGVSQGQLNPHVHGAAGLFLFRHYVELALKYVLFYSRWLEDHSKNAEEVVLFKKTHDLNWLWERIKEEVPAKLGVEAWNGFDTAFVEQLVCELHRADPGSYGFRYNGETFGVEPRGVVEELAVDYGALLNQMKHVYNVLHSMQVYLIETHGQNAEWQAENNSL